jgi:transcriptional regulator NrdR family protein
MVDAETRLIAPFRRGLECKSCGCRHFRVLYTRAGSNGKLIRRRECRHCGRRMTTWEQHVGQALT